MRRRRHHIAHRGGHSLTTYYSRLTVLYALSIWVGFALAHGTWLPPH